MIDTKLILIEGLPGSGKSTTAQFVSHLLTHNGIQNNWWYEEEKNHPVYVFNGEENMQEILHDLAIGNYKPVITKTLEQWRKFTAQLHSSEEVSIADSTFFGYLTWTLFPMNVPVEEIAAYLAEVERVILPCKPSLIYFQQDDIYASLRHICDRRGGDTEEQFVKKATQSRYGIHKELEGFDGMVSFWKDYRSFTDERFENSKLNRLAIENSKGDWEQYLNEIADFLEVKIPIMSAEPLNDTYIGKYQQGDIKCEISRVGETLIIDGIPNIWPKSRLIQRKSDVYEVESMPIRVQFIVDQIIITGPPLFDGEVDYRLTKVVIVPSRLEEDTEH